MSDGSDTSKQADVDAPAFEKPPAKKHPRWRWMRRLLGAGVLLMVLAVGLLFATGWPLAPLAPLANHLFEPVGLRLDLDQLWLRARTSGKLQLKGQKITVGDAVQPEAVVIENLVLNSPLSRLIRADPLSVDISVERIQLSPRLTSTGQWVVVEAKVVETEDQTEPATIANGLVTPPILQRFWTDPMHPLQILCEEVRILFPENSPFSARSITLEPSIRLSATENHQLALDGSLGEIQLDDVPLASASLSGTIKLTTAKAVLKLYGSLADTALLGEFLPLEQTAPPSLAIDAKMNASFGWDPIRLERCDIQIDSEGGEIELPGRTLLFPAWEVRITAEAANFTPLPDATIHLESDLWANGRQQPPAKSHVDFALQGPEALATVSAATDGWSLSMLQNWVEGLENLDASGSFGADIFATYSIQTASLLEAKASIVVEEGEVSLPGILRQPLTIAPTRIEAQITQAFETGHILPFAFIAGPIMFECDGLQWSFDEAQIGGEGSFTLTLPSGSDLTQWIEADALIRLPATPEEFSEIALDPIAIEVTAVGSGPEEVKIEGKTSTRLRLNDGHLDFNTTTEVDTAKRTWSTTVELPTFDPGSWHMQLFKRLPVPDLTLPMSLQLSANGTLDGELSRATWEYNAGPGIIRPNGPLAAWLQAEIPVDKFILGGQLREQGRIAELDTCDFHSGRARMRFTRAQVDIPQSVLAGLPTEATVRFGLLLEHWHPIDFLPLLAGELRKKIPLSAEEVEELGLTRLELTAETKLALDHTGAWIPHALEASVDTDFIGGQADVPIATKIGFDPQTGIVTATATSARISPDIWKLKPLALLPIALTGTAIPLQFEVRLSAGLPGLAKDETPRVGFVLNAGPGPLNAPDFLQSPVGIEELAIDLQVRLDSLELEQASVLLDLDGPSIRLQRLRAVPDKAFTSWQTAAELSVDDLSLDWALSKLTPTLWQGSVPPAFRPSHLEGKLGLNLVVATLVETESFSIPKFNHLTYDMKATDLRIDWKDRPPLTLTQFNLEGDADACAIHLRNLGSGGWTAEKIKALIQNPLAEIPTAQLEVQIAGDLGTVGGLFEAWAEPLELGESPLPQGLDGTVHISLMAQAPLSQLDLKKINARVQTKVENVPLAPLVPCGPSAGNASFAGTMSLADGRAQATGEAKLSGIVWNAFIKGDASITIHGESDTVSAAGSIEADLTQLQLMAPDDLWKKPRGQAASFSASGFLPSGWPKTGQREARWTLATEGFIFEQTRAKGSISVDPIEGAPYGGLQTAHLEEFEFDAGKLSGTLTVDSKLIDLAVAIEHFDVPILLQRTAAIARPLQATADRTTTEASPTVDASPTPTDPSLNLHLAVTGDKLHLGDGHAIDRLYINARLINNLPHSMSARFDIDGDPARIELGPPHANQHQLWSIDIANLGGLFDSLTAPTREVPAFFPPDSPIPPLNAYVGTILGGHLDTNGWIHLDPNGPIFEATLKIDGIAFRQEIPLLSKFASLAKKDLMLQVPCHVFQWANLHFENQQFSARDGFIDGPINLSFESILADLAKETLNAKGSIFALCFELDGPLTAPSPYLCEDNKVIRALTSEDEFVW